MLSDHPLPTSVGMNPSPPPVEIPSSEIPSSLVPTDASDEVSASFHSTPEFDAGSIPNFYTGPTPVTTTTTGLAKFYTGSPNQETRTGPAKFYTGPRTGNNLVGGSSTTSGPTPTGNTTNSATGTTSVSNIDARDVHTLYALAQAAETVRTPQPSLPYTQSYGCTTVTPSTTYTRSGFTASRPIQGPYLHDITAHERPSTGFLQIPQPVQVYNEPWACTLPIGMSTQTRPSSIQSVHTSGEAVINLTPPPHLYNVSTAVSVVGSVIAPPVAFTDRPVSPAHRSRSHWPADDTLTASCLPADVARPQRTRRPTITVDDVTHGQPPPTSTQILHWFPQPGN